MGDDVQLHAISRSQYRRRDQCNFPSQARTNVCQRRADVLEMLNDGDNQIYMYSDAQGMFYNDNQYTGNRNQEVPCNSYLKILNPPNPVISDSTKIHQFEPETQKFKNLNPKLRRF